MKMVDMGPLDEVFTHVEDETGVQTSYAVDALYQRCVAGGAGITKFLAPVEEGHAQYCMERRGVEHERLAELVAHPEWLAKPIMFIEMPAGKNEQNSHLLVDGTHRYVAWFRLGMTQIPAYTIAWDVAKDCIIEDLPSTPEDELMQHSHLTLMRKLFGMANE